MIAFLTKWTQSSAAIIALVGAAPIYASTWLVTQALLESYPAVVREWADTLMYSEYQEFVRLFFQMYTGVKVACANVDGTLLFSLFSMEIIRSKRTRCIFPTTSAQVSEGSAIPESILMTCSRLVRRALAGHAGLLCWQCAICSEGGLCLFFPAFLTSMQNALRLMPWYGWYFEQVTLSAHHQFVTTTKAWLCLRSEKFPSRSTRHCQSDGATGLVNFGPAPVYHISMCVQFWLAIFPEGTRFSGTAVSLASSHEHARARGILFFF